MSIRKRNKGYQIDISHDHRRYRVQISGDHGDAIITEQLIIKELKTGRSWDQILQMIETSKKDLTVSAILSKIKHQYNDKHGIQTATNVVHDLGSELKITDLDEDHIDQMIELWKSRGNSNATCNRKLAVISKILNHAYKRSYIKIKPCIEWLKEGAGRIRYLKETEQILFCNILRSGGHHDLVDLVTVACDTGFRKSELKRIDLRRDLDGDQLTCQATKNDTIRTINLTKRSKAILHRRGNNPFSNITDEYLRSAWNFGKIKMGLENDHQFTFHCTRHTCASRLVQRGIGIQVVQSWLGHKTIKMTLRYAHLNPNNFIEARNVLDQISSDKSGDNKVTSI
tara:strand:+ start:1110 stop:2132 length:1023 start_codon:yes stop_codon:yes gene_type:complete